VGEWLIGYFFLHILWFSHTECDCSKVTDTHPSTTALKPLFSLLSLSFSLYLHFFWLLINEVSTKILRKIKTLPRRIRGPFSFQPSQGNLQVKNCSLLFHMHVDSLFIFEETTYFCFYVLFVCFDYDTCMTCFVCNFVLLCLFSNLLVMFVVFYARS
jgi:hypothetical protein